MASIALNGIVVQPRRLGAAFRDVGKLLANHLHPQGIPVEFQGLCHVPDAYSNVGYTGGFHF